MKALIQKIKRLLRDRKFRLLWSRTISVVAALVVFVTTYALVLPAITMEREAYCGIPAHQHTDACFEQRLICTTPESPGHHHDDACYTTHQELACQMEEHTHDPTACYDAEGTLVCQLPEHVHDQTACWKDVTELTCTVEESDGHQHSDACYENVLVCGMEVHTHSEECYHNPDEDAEANAVAAMQDGGDGTGAETPDEGVVFETYEDFAGDEIYESSDPNGEEGLPADDGTGIPYDEPILNEEALLNEEGLPGGEGLPSDEGMEGMAAGQEIEGIEDGMPADGEGTTNGEDGMPEQGTDGNPDAAVDENGNPIAGTQTDTDENGNPILDPDAPQETAETAETAQAATGGQLDPEGNTYVPNLAPIDFAAALNKRTGIYYYAVQEGETVEDSSSISGWKKIEKNTELGPNDLLRVYLAYTIPAGSLNKTNPTAVYRLPVGLRLTDAQVNAINAVENGIAAQYIDYNTLTLIDPDNYHRYLGAEVIEGTRKPDQDLNEYLKEHTADGGEAQEFISATVRVENVYGTESSSGDGDSLLCQNLIFTFSPYTIEKNQHTYDASGQPTRAGEKVRGWFTLDFNLAQVNLGEPRLEETADAAAANPVNAENAADGSAGAENPAAEMEARLVRVIRTAEIVFVQEDQSRGLEEISTQITVVTEEEMVNTGENSEVGNDYPAETDEADENNENHENDGNIEETAENEETEKTAVEGNNADEPDANAAEVEAKKEKTDEEKEAELKEALASMMPAISFEDSIRVRTGKPAGVVEGDSGAAAANAAEALPRKAKVTVRVEADEGTFPVGTTMVLSTVEDLDAVAETVRDAVENGAAGEAPENGEATDAGSDHTTGNAEKTNPANAANASNNPKTYGFQAVDISFRDADGNEIEPAKPVRVALTSEIVEQIKKDKEADGTTAIADPVVVHVDDKGNAEKMDLIAPEEIEPAQGRTEEEIREELEKAAAEEAVKQEDEEKEVVERDGTEEATTSEEQVGGDEDAENGVPEEEHQTQDPAPSGESSVFFEAESFSIYAIVYTVDFHYEVNGKTFEFSIPGGGFVSLEHLVEVLGIANPDSNAGAASEVPDVEDETYEHSITLNSLPVSEATKQFVADIVSVEFSHPEYVWTGRIDAGTTVGRLKETNELEVHYSADLTKEQMKEINAQPIEAGDWALISMFPFRSQETLRVTMKNGEAFEIQVTDAQIRRLFLSASGETFEIIVTYDETAGIPDGAELEVDEILQGTEDYLKYADLTREALNEKMTAVSDEGQSNNNSEDEAEKNGDIEGEDASSETGEDGSGFARILEEEDKYDLSFARFFDIRIVSDGKIIEPVAPVDVRIIYVDPIEMEEGEELLAIHFGKEETELIDIAADQEMKDLSFTQGSFSVTGTIVTTQGSGWPSNGSYVIYTQIGEDYFAIKHDGTLVPVVQSGNQLSFQDAEPLFFETEQYLWNFTHSDAFFLRPETNTISFTEGESTYYINPVNEAGIGGNRSLSRNSYRLYTSNNGYTNYLTATSGEGGVFHLAGQGSAGSAIPVYFANGFSAVRKLTVHFVDREGNPIPGVRYTGTSDYVAQNPNDDGTFAIPYSWSGHNGIVDFKNEFSKSGYTYASTHLAGTLYDTDLTYEGLAIDAKIQEKGNNLYYLTDDAANRKYDDLVEKNFNAALSMPYAITAPTATTYGTYGTTTYTPANKDKDVYVILDPIPVASGSAGSSGNGEGMSIDKPDINKQKTDNGDGTYDLSLSVTGHGRDVEEVPRANVLLVVDTSSSMNKITTGNNTRLTETEEALKRLGGSLLAHNADHPGSVELAMISFDGSVVNELGWTGDQAAFNGKVDNLEVHRGTNWEDALKEALRIGVLKKNAEPGEQTFVIFFTDGEGSQYTNFSGKGEDRNSGYGYQRWYSYFLSRETSKDEARAIVNSGLKFYSVYAFNEDTGKYYGEGLTDQEGHPVGESGSNLLENLVKYAYNVDSLNPSDHYYEKVENAQQLNNAFDSILELIFKSIGHKDVEIIDGITTLTSTALVEGHAENFVYTVSKYEKSVDGNGNAVYTEIQGTAATVEKEGTDQLKLTFPDGTVDYISQASYSESEKKITWQLGEDYQLRPDYTYKVNFTVWPSQQSYDYIADLRNGIATWTDNGDGTATIHYPDNRAGDLVTSEIVKTGSNAYALRTNVSAGNVVNYYTVETERIVSLPEGVTIPEGENTVTSTDPETGVITVYTKDGTHYTRTTKTPDTLDYVNPDPMPLEDHHTTVQKKWVVARDSELVDFLYNTSTGEPISANKNIVFDIYQGELDNPYKAVVLGYDEDSHSYDWAGTTRQVNGFTIGSAWEEQFDIAFGLMLSPEKAVEHSIDIDGDPRVVPVYANADSTEVLYYVLERGHDYTIQEPTVSYRFDFHTDIFHPMLVDHVPRDVKIDYVTRNNRTIGILTYISPTNETLSGLTGENVLRGELKIRKNILDENGETDHSDEAGAATFPIYVELENIPEDGEPGPFYNGETAAEHHIPWYGVTKNIEGVDVDFYYHKFEDGKIVYLTEGEACVDGSYDDGGLKPGCYGNIMEYDENDRTKVWATIYIKTGETWTITNIPGETTYSITETPSGAYQFAEAEEIGTDPENKVVAPEDPLITGIVHANHTTEVEFTNQKHLEPIDVIIVKADVNDLDEENPELLPGAAFTLEKYTDSTYRQLDTEWEPEDPAGKKSITDTEGTGTFSFAGLTEGYYRIVETQFPDGYIRTETYPIFRIEGNMTTGEYEVILLEKVQVEAEGGGTKEVIRDVENNNDGVVKIENTKITVGNTPGAALPNTGGSGTLRIYLTGLLLTAVAGLCLWIRREYGGSQGEC